MKITPEDMDDVTVALRLYPDRRNAALALILERIYDRGYADGRSDEWDAQQHNDL